LNIFYCKYYIPKDKNKFVQLSSSSSAALPALVLLVTCIYLQIIFM
jgi:hypothetical protein